MGAFRQRWWRTIPFVLAAGFTVAVLVGAIRFGALPSAEPGPGCLLCRGETPALSWGDLAAITAAWGATLVAGKAGDMATALGEQAERDARAQAEAAAENLVGPHARGAAQDARPDSALDAFDGPRDPSGDEQAQRDRELKEWSDGWDTNGDRDAAPEARPATTDSIPDGSPDATDIATETALGLAQDAAIEIATSGGSGVGGVAVTLANAAGTANTGGTNVLKYKKALTSAADAALAEAPSAQASKDAAAKDAANSDDGANSADDSSGGDGADGDQP